MKHIKKFEEFLNESKIQPTAGPNAGKIIDYVYDNDVDYHYYFDWEGLEYPIKKVEDAIKKLGIKDFKEVVIMFSDNDIKVYDEAIKMAKKLKLKYIEVSDVDGEGNKALVFSELQ